MNRLTTAGMLAAAILAVLAGPSRADLQAFDFSFTNDPSIGNVAGTVAGVIDLSFLGDGTGPATTVEITSFPSIYSSTIAALPITIPGSPLSTILSNTFTVAGGEITDAYFIAEGTSVGSFDLNAFALNSLEDNYGNETANYDGLSGVTFTPVSVSVPEPSSLKITSMTVACGLIFAVATRRRARGTNKIGL